MAKLPKQYGLDLNLVKLKILALYFEDQIKIKLNSRINFLDWLITDAQY